MDQLRSIRHSFGKYSRIHPLPMMDTEIGDGDASTSSLTTKAALTEGKQKSDSTTTNGNSINSIMKQKLFGPRPPTGYSEVELSPFSGTDTELARGDYPTPYETTKVDWTGEMNRLISSSFVNTTSSDQTQNQLSSSWVSCPDTCIVHHTNDENTPSLYSEEDASSKREMEERKVKYLEQACADIRDALWEQYAVQSSEHKMSKIQDLVDEQKHLRDKLSIAQVRLEKARHMEQTVNYTDIKNSIKFYKHEKRRLNRGYSEDTLLGIDIPVAFGTQKQKSKYLAKEIDTLWKEKKALKKERPGKHILKEVKVDKKNHLE